jgi:hypothetical protein
VYKSDVVSTLGGASRNRLQETTLESWKDDVAVCMRNEVVSLYDHTGSLRTSGEFQHKRYR